MEDWTLHPRHLQGAFQLVNVQLTLLVECRVTFCADEWFVPSVQTWKYIHAVVAFQRDEFSTFTFPRDFCKTLLLESNKMKLLNASSIVLPDIGLQRKDKVLL